MLIRSAIFFSLLILLTVVSLPLHIIVSFISFFQVRFLLPAIYCRSIYWVLYLVGVKYEVSGRENVDKTKNYIILSNHQCAWETLFLSFFFNPAAAVVKRELLRIPLFGWGLALMKPIALNRSNKKESLKKVLLDGKKRLADGLNIVLFPEGTRAEKTGSKKFSKSGALMASQTGYDILPVAHNAGTFITKHFMIKRLGTVKVQIGKPISSKERKAQELYDESTDWIIETASNL